jgi:hypothetical protein
MKAKPEIWGHIKFKNFWVKNTTNKVKKQPTEQEKDL